MGSVRALDRASEVFLKAYTASVGQPLSAANLAFYKAAHCLRGATWDVRAKGTEWHERAEAMLDEGFRALRNIS